LQKLKLFKKPQMSKNLLIVESPAKAKTIEKYLGKDFTVKSSYGHIRDLAKGNKGVDIENNFTPSYIISEEKEAVVKELKKLAKSAEEIWLATDEDREGEAISWHLCEALNLDVKKTKRIVFHEITKTAIQNAVKQPRMVDLNLVDAQQARRVLDRIVGFELSPILWKKLSAGNNLSAGRVQSVAVRLIVEKERDIQNFTTKSFYKIVAYLLAEKDGKLVPFKAELPKKFEEQQKAEDFLNSCKSAIYTIGGIEVKPGKRTPAAPFTTSTLQQEASRKLYYGVTRTMILAQKLYEAGHITYMRTDSVNLSELALENAQKQINKLYGPNFHQKRVYKSKMANAQEAHEAIRPTEFDNIDIDVETDQLKLYQLIWRRAIASQMADAELEKTVANINISTNNETLVATGEVIKFEGFLKVYMEDSDDESEEEEKSTSTILPPLKEGQTVQLREMTATQRFSQSPSRYTEASLVKKLEELGIGRPSTYAPTINTVQQRGYVERPIREGMIRNYNLFTLSNNAITSIVKSETTGAEKNKLAPTDLGMLTSDFLVKHFATILDYGFTAKIEQEFDDIANGDLIWSKMLATFYKPFKETVDTTNETAERVSGERDLGIDPKTGKPMIARMGRFGPMVQIGKASDDEQDKPKFAKLKPNQSINTITLEEALSLFDLPRTVGVFEDTDVVIGEGRFGPYVVHNKIFYSIKKGIDPYTITLEEALAVIDAKRSSVLRVFAGEDISIVEGRWGPYIKAGKKNIKIPKGEDYNSLSLAEIKVLVDAAPEAKARGWGAKKKK
jgi:DNA topoisomerase-1